jgi:hypothetical protein
MEKRDKAPKRGERPSAAGNLMSYSYSSSFLLQETRGSKLDHKMSKLPPATDTTELTPEQAREKAIRGELGSTEMPAKQVW